MVVIQFAVVKVWLFFKKNFLPLISYFCLKVQRKVDPGQMVPDVTLVTRHFPAVYGGVVPFLSSDGEGVYGVPIHVVVHRQAVGFSLLNES